MKYSAVAKATAATIIIDPTTSLICSSRKFVVGKGISTT
jgi:hypothetical protein